MSVRASTAPSRRLVLRTKANTSSIVLGVVAALGAWELGSRILQSRTEQGDRVLPSLTVVAQDGVLGLSNYWRGGLGVEATDSGGAESLQGAVLAVVSNGAITIGRVLLGLSLAILLGVVLGLLVAALRPVRLSVTGVTEVMRMLPHLAMAPLFTLWFGATSTASVVFIIFSVSFVILLAMVNAVSNLPPHLVDFPRTLGVRGTGLWLRVVLPASLPELRGSLMFGGLVAWATVLASEMYGLQTGLGWMLNDTLRFSLVERMVLVALVFSGLALMTMKGLGSAVNRVTRWSE